MNRSRACAVVLLGLLGGAHTVHADWLLTPSVFSGHDLVQSSRVLIVTGRVVVALPDRWSHVVRPSRWSAPAWSTSRLQTSLASSRSESSSSRFETWQTTAGVSVRF